MAMIQPAKCAPALPDRAAYGDVSCLFPRQAA